MNKWKWNADQTALVNTDYIIRLTIEPPMLAQRDFIVVAILRLGSEIMYRGTGQECVDYLNEFGI